MWAEAQQAKAALIAQGKADGPESLEPCPHCLGQVRLPCELCGGSGHIDAAAADDLPPVGAEEFLRAASLVERLGWADALLVRRGRPGDDEPEFDPWFEDLFLLYTGERERRSIERMGREAIEARGQTRGK